MPSKRKRDILDFDPNKSDSSDENFVPGEAGERPRRSKKKQKGPHRSHGTPTKRRRQNRYKGSDIDEDDEVVSDDSLGAPYSEDENDEDDDEDDDAPLTSAAGRRVRKAAVKHLSYRESSEDENEDEDEGNVAAEEESESVDDEDELRPRRKSKSAAQASARSSRPSRPSRSSRPSRIVVLKTSPKKLRERIATATAAPMTRRTRATTEEVDEFMELTNSGRHAKLASSSRSKSPEAYTTLELGRPRRASKGLKKPPAPPIEEATQEDSLARESLADDDVDELGPIGGGDGVEESTLRDSSRIQRRMQRLAAGEDAGDDNDDDDFVFLKDGQHENDPKSGDGNGDSNNNGSGAGAAENDDEGEGEGQIDEDAAEEDVEGGEEEEEEGGGGEADVVMNDDDNDVDDDDEDEDDVKPINRRMRLTRAKAASLAAAKDDNDVAEEAAADAGDEGQDTVGRRLTRGSRLRKAKSLKEPSSDFEPMDDEESGDAEIFDSDESPKKKKRANTTEDDSSQNSRGRRRSTRLKVGSKRSHHESDEEDDVDRDEVAMEAEELRASSHSRPRRRRRRRSPSIVYEETSRRRTTKVVDYSIKPLDQFLIEQEEEADAAQTPARRRNARGGNASTWQRNLLSTFGPFGGGGGAGALIGGPWGTGAAGNVDSDSSDDEMNYRTDGHGAIGGNVGMTPTAGTAPSGFAAPLNLEAITGVSANANVGKIKNQKALADADPLGVDMSVDFSKVGGLQGHINQLKEMVTLPLLYPELFLRFKVTPPRGVLFHGPPGTGKTLLARALANSVGLGGRKITFYMRKGADALSKWVGEAEKQLRLLFEEARRTQPSIIFFDEIDGLAPVRSSKQEQIHASIVSTLLALMDGMDGRGQVIVIGATNRPDNIDPALRRPGRFDREFYFPLPDLEGRRAIIDIHTKDWGLTDNFKAMLAEHSKGYGGADLRALATEAALNAIQRTYPQIYSAPEKLVVDPEKISIHATDFMLSMNRMIPSSERSAAPAWAPLPKAIAPLLSDQLTKIQELLDDVMPRRKKTTALEEAMFEPLQDADHGFGRENMVQEFERSRTFRPRLLLTGVSGMGQGYLAAAILNHFEGVHIQSFDLASLLGDGRPLEQVIVGFFIEVKRHKPAVLYIPNVDVWYNTLPGSAYMTFVTMLKSIPPNDPVLVLGTCECENADIPPAVLRDFFGYSYKNRLTLERPSRESRRNYFYNFLKHAANNPNDFPDPANRKKRVLEELPVAPPPPPRIKTKAELDEELRKDHLLLNLLKVQLQPIMDQIKKYKKFRQPVIPESQIQYLWQEADPNYVQPDLPNEEPRPFMISKDKNGVPGLVEKATSKFYYNLDLSTIEERLSNGYYARPKDFYLDVVSLAKDARNIGDKERLLKANELVTNVEVDVAEAEARLNQVNWDELYQRQLQRAKETEEKALKKRAGLAIFGAATGGGDDADFAPLVTSDVVRDDDGGPTHDDEPLTAQQQMQRQARFQLKPTFAEASSSSPSNGYHHVHLSNGMSVPSAPVSNGGEDAVMMDSPFGATPQKATLPPQWPRSSALDSSTRATAGNTQVSQVSALTELPTGMSPSAVLNEASTTKTSDPSSLNRSSGPWSTQATNGVHGAGANGSGGHGSTVAGAAGGGDAGEGSQIPDTQSIFGSLPSQAPSSNEWVHSQMHALAKGDLDGNNRSRLAGSGPENDSTLAAAAAAAAGSSSSPPQRPSQSQQHSPVQPLGPPPLPPLSQSQAQQTQQQQTQQQQQQQQQQGGSRLSSQGFPISAPDANLDPILDTILDRTSGCTVDQLEQISREIMDYIWITRHERNRARVINNLSKVFNKTLADIEQMQGLASSLSQDKE
ncbi:aaa family ATPase [Niveomyces insectorum RCEF 264]|uniref:Aaa family ATPase n=1 Tax=Niveomyces insectorum RCEF 264 TaxID=1081102 RepID=A0A162MEF8_9HYPO|nr:aaa family ATPase [Niveomyces insectorum RCEF 264]